MNYYEIEVQLMSGPHLPPGWMPGRVFYTPGSVTLLELGEAIDSSLGRWDLSAKCEFKVGKKRYSIDEEGDPNETTLDQVGMKAGTKFSYVFNLGDGWSHQCLVKNVAPHLYRMFDGWKPDGPVAVYGWGSMPDQYGVDYRTDDGPVEDFPDQD
jgi:Plasmid pRiA4b ORF-3-like protein